MPMRPAMYSVFANQHSISKREIARMSRQIDLASFHESILVVSVSLRKGKTHHGGTETRSKARREPDGNLREFAVNRMFGLNSLL